MNRNDEDLRWGIVGASWMARQWMAGSIQAVPGHRVVAVSSSSRERGERFAGEFGIPHRFDDWKDMILDPGIDAVYLGSTNDLHASQALFAVQHGVHVLCEKPVALTVDDAVGMERAARRAGVVLRSNHHLRFMDTHRKLRDLIRDGAIGRVLAVRINHTRYLPEALHGWRLTDRDAGGIVLDITVHDVDTVRFILDDEVSTVTATPLSQGLGDGVEDGVAGVMQLASGAHVVFHESFALPHSGTSVEMHGSEGVILADEILNAHPAGTIVLRRTDEPDLEIEVGPRANAYERLIEEFGEAVRTGGEGGVGFAHAIRSLEVALAVKESMASRSSVEV